MADCESFVIQDRLAAQRGELHEGEIHMSYPVEIVERSAQATASVRTRASVSELPDLMGSTFCQIAEYLGKVGAQPTGPPFAAYYNMDMQDLDIEIGFPVSELPAGEGDIQLGKIPGGKFAACLYTGPYAQIESAYNALGEWLKQNDREATGVCYEVYLNDPAETPPEQLQTQILFPLTDA